MTRALTARKPTRREVHELELMLEGDLTPQVRRRADKYVTETIKMLREKPDPISISEIFRQVACLGSIHDTAAQLSPP